MIIRRVEQHQIEKSHALFPIIDDYSLRAKNLYNYANYLVRQVFIITSKLSEGKEISFKQHEFLEWINQRVDEFNIKREKNLKKKHDKGKELEKQFKPLSSYGDKHKYLGYAFLQYLCCDSECYNDIMAQVSQQVLRLLDKNWISFFESIKKWSECKDGYTGRPRLPKYKHKEKGRFNIYFTNQNCKISNGFLQFPKCFNQYLLKTKVKDNLNQVRIKPSGSRYLIEIVYSKEVNELDFESKNICSIDLGLNNLATLTNNAGKTPVIINGRPLKSINQYYNKEKAKIVSSLKRNHDRDWSKRLDCLTTKRNNKVKDYLHKASNFIVRYCIESNIDTIVIGENKDWKREIELGKRTNQNFVGIPYSMLLNMISYKAQDSGIKVIKVEESYTSGTSFLDEEMPVKENYNISRRITRGLFKANNEELINADVNGSLQIMKKVFPNASADGIEGVGLHPVKANIA